MKNVISRVKGSQPAPILLVANKLDLECQREVSTVEGKLRTGCWNIVINVFDYFLFRKCISRTVGLSIY